MISWLWVTATTTLSLLLLAAGTTAAAHNATNSRTGLTVTADQQPQQQRTVVLGAKISERLTTDSDYYAAADDDDWHLWSNARPDAPPSSTSERLFSRRNVDHQLELNQQQTTRKRPIYTNQFVIKVKGGVEAARQIAQRHGFIFLNHILDDYYHLEHRRLARRSPMDNSQVALNLTIQEEPEVLLIERQVLKRRVKRDFLELSTDEPARQRQQSPTWPANQPAQRGPQRPSQQQLLRPAHQYTRPANQPPARRPPPSSQYGQQEPLETAASSAQLIQQQQQQQQPQPAGRTQLASPLTSNSSGKPAPFNDPSWPLMWYLDGGARNGFDLNVREAWKMGYTGRNIVITILDDGLEKDHPDLAANYDPWASFDINGDDADPMPRYDTLDSNRHGTRCAGEVAAVPDNNICSIGIAYNSKVGGVRMLDGEVTDAVEARSLSLNNQYIHIYSASWGPDDNGKTVDGPGEMATRAFIEGVTNGRQGLGSIFVFASGNGGREHDNCNCDGYTNSIWTLSISSATENGNVPWYIEACSSTLATTYSSGSYEERQIVTTDLHHSCTSAHTGTSASAPLAAGICALVLESNPRLTWRDMQHIVVRTARPANLVAKDWRTNGLGRNVSHAFGYGLMDAAAMIHLARRWTTVPVQYTCEVRSPPMERFIPAKGYIELKLNSSCDKVRFLEHVQSKVTLASSRRGDLHIYLVSPHGTRSTLLAQRPNDHAEQGFRNWPFMTVHNWGESPNGVWTLEVHNDGKPQNRAFLKEWTLILYGTNEDPNRHLDGPPTRPTTGQASQPMRPPPPMPPIGQPARPPQPPETEQPVSSSTPAPPAPPAPALKPLTQWTFQGRPPATTPAPVGSTSISSSTTSSTTSYLSTFKTSLVSNQAAGPSQQLSKADFEIVSAAGEKQTTSAPTTTLAAGPTPPVSTSAPPVSVTTQQSGNLSSAMMKPSVELMPPQPQPPAGTQNNELEQQDNQMDSANKLNKEYRSSGDQSRRPQVSETSSVDKSARLEPNWAISVRPAAAVVAAATALALSSIGLGGKLVFMV